MIFYRLKFPDGMSIPDMDSITTRLLVEGWMTRLEPPSKKGWRLEWVRRKPSGKLIDSVPVAGSEHG